MEENPIYGNLSFVETSKWIVCVCISLSLRLYTFVSVYNVMLISTDVAVFTKAEPSRDKQRVNSDSQVVFYALVLRQRSLM